MMVESSIPELVISAEKQHHSFELASLKFPHLSHGYKMAAAALAAHPCLTILKGKQKGTPSHPLFRICFYQRRKLLKTLIWLTSPMIRIRLHDQH